MLVDLEEKAKQNMQFSCPFYLNHVLVILRSNQLPALSLTAGILNLKLVCVRIVLVIGTDIDLVTERNR